MDGPVGLQKVGLEVHIEPVSRQSLNRVIDGQNVNPLSVLDVRAGRNRDDVAKTDAEVVADNPEKWLVSLSDS